MSHSLYADKARCRKHGGKEHEFEIGNLKICYKIADESFDHAFGTEYQIGFDILKIEFFIDETDYWIDITDNLGKLSAKIDDLIQEDMSEQMSGEDYDED